MAGSRGDRGLYDGRNISGASMWLEVGTTYIHIYIYIYIYIYIPSYSPQSLLPPATC